MAHMSKGRTVENERKWQEKPSSPSLIDPRLHPHFCFRHFYLSAFCPSDQSRIYRVIKIDEHQLGNYLVSGLEIMIIDESRVLPFRYTRKEFSIAVKGVINL